VQEAITLVIFSIFAAVYLKEPLEWRYIAGFLLILAAVLAMFWK